MNNEHFRKIASILEKIDERLKTLNEKIDRINRRLDSNSRLQTITTRTAGLDVEVLLSLPSHLRKTAISICRLGEATSAEVAKDTGRARAAESDYLNQLVSMDYLGKKRIDRKVVFYVKK